MTTIEFYQYMIHIAVMITILTGMAVYLLTSKRNAFGDELVNDQRLRHKAGWTILVYVAIYLVDIPIAFWITDDLMLMLMVSVTLDMTIYLPMVFCFLLETLQDRRRWDNRLWGLSVLAVIPLAGRLLTGQAWWTYAVIGLYLAELTFIVVWYVRATMEYRRFLADNYADMEHKESVWNWLILCSIFFSIVNYSLLLSQSDIHVVMTYSYALHAADIIFYGIIVLHLDHLQILKPLAEERVVSLNTRKDIIISKTGELLRKHCEATQLYLQHDLSLKAVAQACHTNRTYLSLYFASQDITYYRYINKLRIEHFQSLYRQALKEKNTPPTLQQLSMDSGFISYNTFSRAFHSCTGTSVSKWLEQINRTV